MIQTLEKIVYWLDSFATGADVDDVCILGGPVLTKGGRARSELDDESPEFVIGQKNGDLVTVLDIRGARKYVGFGDFERMTENFGRALSNRMKAGSGKSHSFSMGFRSDPGHAGEVVRRALAPAMQTAKNLGIENTKMLEHRAQTLASFVSDESVYLVLRTHSRDLQPHEAKSQQAERVAIAKESAKAGSKINKNLTQDVVVPLGALLPKHIAAVNSLLNDLRGDINSGGAQLQVNALPVHDAVVAIRRHVQSAMVPAGWRPRLNGDRFLGGSAVGARGEEVSRALAPRLAGQMVSSGGLSDHFGSRELCEYGGAWYGSVVLTLCPESGSKPFDDLANRLGRSIPWRVSFEILPNGTNYRQVDKMLSMFLGAVGDYNKSIRAAHDQLRAIANEGEVVTALRATFSTWADERKQAERNLADLSSAIESWGAASCSNETGEPSRAMLSSAAGFSGVSPAPFLPAPLSDVARMMPFARPASVWETGQLLTTTLEGRLYPIAFGTSMQAYWSTIGFAPTGSGKSFTLNVLNSGLLLRQGATEVPPITLVDVGKSGALVMKWYQSILPERLRHQVAAISIRNHVDYCVNPFDTQPFLDEPLQDDVAFLVAVLGTMSPGLGDEAGKFFELLIRTAFEKYSRKSPDSKRWQNAYNERIGKRLDAMGYVVKETTRVWDVVDALFDAGHVDDAIAAQVYGMPVIPDLPKVAEDPRVAQLYGRAMVGSERLIDKFIRNISVAVGSYAIMSSYTRFSMGSVRAVSIDLQEVVGDMTSEEGRRRSGLMFLFARRLGARNYFLSWDDVSKHCPPKFLAWQKTRVAKLWETLKFLQYDEAHYFSGIEEVTNLVGSDLRTGRKFNLITAMFSQLLTDFSKALLDNTYIILIMGLGDASKNEVKAAFDLSDDEMHALERYCVRPGMMFARFKTKVGTLTQVLRINASAYEKWAFTTQGKDQTLRAALTELVSYEQTLDLLVKWFPSGTAENYMLKLEVELADQAGGNEAAVASTAAKRLIERDGGLH